MFSQTHKKRLLILTSAAVLTTLVAGLILFALKNNINLFFTPKELLTNPPPTKAMVRVGGMVSQNSVAYLNNPKQKNQIHIQFKIHDGQSEIPVEYHGVLPDLFREGQGVVVQGYWRPPQFEAVTVLAKHDENYMPPAVMKAMQEVT